MKALFTVLNHVILVKLDIYVHIFIVKGSQRMTTQQKARTVSLNFKISFSIVPLWCPVGS